MFVCNISYKISSFHILGQFITGLFEVQEEWSLKERMGNPFVLSNIITRFILLPSRGMYQTSPILLSLVRKDTGCTTRGNESRYFHQYHDC